MAKRITVDAERVEVRPGTRDYLRLEFEAEPGELLECFDAQEITRNFDNDALLDAIGEDAARKYFGIEAGE